MKRVAVMLVVVSKEPLLEGTEAERIALENQILEQFGELSRDRYDLKVAMVKFVDEWEERDL